MSRLVNITTERHHVVVRSPYNKSFVEAAKLLGGKFKEGDWRFAVLDFDAVRALCIDVYGTDGTGTTSRTARVHMIDDLKRFNDSITLAGRPIARAVGRDSGARLGEGVVFLSGRPSSGGSVKNWCTVIPAGSVFEIRNIPEAAIYLIHNELGGKGTIEVIATPPDCVSAMLDELVGLQAEHARVYSRIDELRAALMAA